MENPLKSGKNLVGAEGQEKLPENVVVLEKPQARYRIIYESHAKTHSPEVLGSADALAVEFISDKDYKNPQEAEEIIKQYWLAHALRIEGDRIDIRLREAVERKRLPLFLIDIADPTGDFQKKREATGGVLRVVEGIFGIGLLGKVGLEAVMNKKPMTRRDFLKTALQGGIAAYLGSSHAEKLLSDSIHQRGHPRESDKLRKIERTMLDLQEKIHPEVYALTLTLRNAIFSLKVESIAEEIFERTGVGSEVALLVGGGHIGIEKMFEIPREKRVEIVAKILDVFKLPEIKQQAPTIAELNFDVKEDTWKTARIFKDKYLAKLN